MRDREEIQRAHDLLVGIILGDAPMPLSDEERKIVSANVDVLCWVLEHDHNRTFATNLELAQEQTRAAGWELKRLPMPIPRNQFGRG